MMLTSALFDSIINHASLQWLTAVLLTCVVLYVRSVGKWRTRSCGRPLPPGPPSLPIVGNLFNIPKSKMWLGFKDLSLRYGDILHVHVLGQSTVVLGSAEVIMEYLDKRSANTSDRFQTPMIELSGSSYNLGLMPYGTRWRRHRRTFWQHFHQTVVTEYRPIQKKICRIFVLKMLQDPSRLVDHIKYSFAASILKVVYGLDAAHEDDKYVNAVDEALVGPTQGLKPGKYMVEYLPFLRYVPTWFPGASSQRLFKKWQEAGERLKEMPFNDAKNALLSDPEGPQSSSILARLMARLADHEADSEEEEIMKNVGAITFEAGADTSYSTTQFFFLAMSLYPEVLKKAQAELDAVVGRDRLPDFDDEDSLVYVQAIIRETLRWFPIAPFGVPHSTTADDELHGYFIPAGTVLLPNVWAVMRDPEVYEDSEEFRPERFIKDGKIDPSIRDPFDFAFGFGRRICPGRYFARAGLFINIASALHVFDIGPPLDDDGRPIKVIPDLTDSLLGYPEDCRCTIRPRSAWAKALILAEENSKDTRSSH